MSIFELTKNPFPHRSVFNLSFEKLFTCKFGQLIPVMCEEVVPGDYWEIGNNTVIRFMPLVAPLMSQIEMTIYYFFVPNRLLWNVDKTHSWEAFITGGEDGSLTPTLPVWAPTNTALGSLWDYLGLPVGVDPVGMRPVDFIRGGYNLIYNTHFRDENLIAEVALTNENILKAAYKKDYFTSALPWQQRGTAPALPISGSVNAVFPGAVTGSIAYPAVSSGSAFAMQGDQNSPFGPFNTNTKNLLERGVPSIPKATMDNNQVNLAGATTFDISYLRLVTQTQRWLERNARSGVRYTEFLKAHFGVAPRDERLQRPEYIGGTKCPVIFSEVLQTSATGVTGGSTAQGTMAGHGLAVSRGFCGKYHAQEYGFIYGIMTIRPQQLYCQGVDRQYFKTTKLDYYFPEFAHLSEQAVLRGELYATANSGENLTIFGYQGRFNELRAKQNKLAGQMRPTGSAPFTSYSTGRFLGSAPLLNQSFIEVDDADSNRIFAVTSGDKLIVNCGNLIKCARPMPFEPDPGFMDH